MLKCEFLVITVCDDCQFSGTMDCVKHEEDPQSLAEIKPEPKVSCKVFILCYLLITLMIDILKHISIVVCFHFVLYLDNTD